MFNNNFWPLNIDQRNLHRNLKIYFHVNMDYRNNPIEILINNFLSTGDLWPWWTYLRPTLCAWSKRERSRSAGHRAECASVRMRGAASSVWAMGIASMYAKAQTEARRALNVTKMATKGRSAGRKSPSASSAKRERISAPRSTILERETASYREALAVARSRCHR